ncbi:MAG: cell division protein FtsA [Candidatus Sumerlaea chitinivorans]|nr:cell division protein FtsA [Candidatus Sumerlaea chitinivorans]
MGKKRIVTGLDIGTTKICAIQGYIDDKDQINIIGFAPRPSYGLRCGKVVDIEQTVASIQSAVQACEENSGYRIREVFVGIAGNHVRSLNVSGGIEIANPQRGVTEEDRRKVIQRTIEKLPRQEGETILHCIPNSYSVDDAHGVQNPIGMTGNQLTVHMHIVLADTFSMGNITRCIQRAGITPRETVLESLASAVATLTPEARKAGVILLDIGGGTTDIAVIDNDSVIFTGVVPCGGDNVTRDIYKVLHCSPEEAENLKIRSAQATSRGVDPTEVVEYTDVLADKTRTVSRAFLCEIVEAQLELIFTKVRDLLTAARIDQRLKAGVVLTGGTALLKGIEDVAGRVLDKSDEVVVRYPDCIHGLKNAVKSPAYSTCVGLVIGALRNDPLVAYPIHHENVVSRFIERMRRIFDTYFY